MFIKAIPCIQLILVKKTYFSLILMCHMLNSSILVKQSENADELSFGCWQGEKYNLICKLFVDHSRHTDCRVFYMCMVTLFTNF